MRIGKLYNIHKGEDIYIVGTGPTARMLPSNILSGRITIGLNQAYKNFNVLYSITVHPELEVEYRDVLKANPSVSTKWIVKQKPPTNLPFDDPGRYVFKTSPEWAGFIGKDKDTLFVGRGVQQTAIDMACRMGARAIFLIGVDMSDLGGDHHSHNQHVRFHGLPHEDVYSEYRAWTYKSRKLAREKAKIPVLSLSPLLGCGGAIHDADYVQLRDELGLAKLPEPKDTSGYSRSKIDNP
jgi:hypothetical protein